MAEPSAEERLRRLEARIAAAKKAQEPGPRVDEHYSRANQAWRMVIELVAGILIGLGIGLGLDALFGTRPIFLVLFILLGFAGGVQTMMRTAKEIQAEDETGRRGDAPGKQGD
ncbi:MAG: AtpZ/AtpI family protein [Celeribacter sp.]|jgi:ATP synthase protein I